MRAAWAGYVEHQRGCGQLESPELRARVTTFQKTLEGLPRPPAAGSPERWSECSLEAIETIRQGETLVSDLGGKARVGGSGGGYIVTALLAGTAVYVGWKMLQPDGGGS